MGYTENTATVLETEIASMVLNRADRVFAHLCADLMGSLSRPMSIGMITVTCNEFICAASEVKLDMPHWDTKEGVVEAYKKASYAKLQFMAFVSSIQKEIRSRDMFALFNDVQVVKDGVLVFELK